MTTVITDLSRTVLDDADTDDWTGTDGLDTSAPDPVEASGSLGLVVSTETQEAYDTITSDDWSAGGTFSVWCRAYGAMDTKSAGGIQLVIGDGTDRNGYHVGGSDVTGFRHFEGPVEWANFIIDPANLPLDVTNFAGTEANLTLSAVTQVGVAYKTLAKSVGGSRNCHVDIMRWANIGEAITIIGGTTAGAAGNMAEAAAADRSTASTDAHGVVHELASGVYGIQGNIVFGSTVGTSNQYWTEVNATYAWEDRGLSIDNYYQFSIIGDTGVTCEYSFTACIFTVPQATSASFDANDTLLDVVTMAACTFAGFDRGIETSQDTGDNWTNCIYSGNGTIVANGCDLTGSTVSAHLIPIIDAQDETSYDNSPTTEGSFTSGAGYAVGDIIWLEDGSKVTVDALGIGSEVQDFTVEAGYGGIVLAEPGVAIAQDKTDGSGGGFTLTPDVDNFAESSALEYNLAVDPDGELDDMTFTMGTVDSHAIEFGTSIPAAITLRGMDFFGYSGTNDLNDSIFHFLDTSGTITVNIIDCTNDGGGFSYRSEGATIDLVIAPKTTKVTVVDSAGDPINAARVLLETADTGGGAGFPYQASTTSLTQAAGTATCTTTAAHLLATGDYVVIRGASIEGYNKQAQITVTGGSTFTYTVDSGLGSPAGGTPIVSYAPLSGLTSTLGVIQSSKTWPASQGLSGRSRKSTASPYFKTARFTIADASGGSDIIVQMIQDGT